jgi:hypothetical protein
MCTLYILSELILMTNVVTYKCNKNLMNKMKSRPFKLSLLFQNKKNYLRQMKQLKFDNLFILNNTQSKTIFSY